MWNRVSSVVTGNEEEIEGVKGLVKKSIMAEDGIPLVNSYKRLAKRPYFTPERDASNQLAADITRNVSMKTPGAT